MIRIVNIMILQKFQQLKTLGLLWEIRIFTSILVAACVLIYIYILILGLSAFSNLALAFQLFTHKHCLQIVRLTMGSITWNRFHIYLENLADCFSPACHLCGDQSLKLFICQDCVNFDLKRLFELCEQRRYFFQFSETGSVPQHQSRSWRNLRSPAETQGVFSHRIMQPWPLLNVPRVETKAKLTRGWKRCL